MLNRLRALVVGYFQEWDTTPSALHLRYPGVCVNFFPPRLHQGRGENIKGVN